MKTLRLIFIFMLFLALFSCGEAPAQDAGLVVSPSLFEHLRSEFESVKICLNVEAGAFDELFIVLMEPSFDCPHNRGKCSGDYIRPATIRLGLPWAWRGEVIHYLLDVNIGRPDKFHRSEYFVRCD